MNPPDPVCQQCGLRRGPGLTCRNCHVLALPDGQEVFLATRWRRLGGSLLESVLFLVTLGVGWLIWLHFTAKTAQTPSKRLLSMYVVMSKQGGASSYGRIWLREIGIEWLLFGVALSGVAGGIVPLIDALWILFDKDKQTLHDKVANTLVVYAPEGIRSIGTVPGADIGAQPPLGSAPRPAPPSGSGPTRAPGGPESYGSSDTRERLRNLRSLWESGEISADEYEERRRKILDEL